MPPTISADVRTTAGLMFDGRRVSLVGAALANGMTIDAFDAHDGHVLTKGHAGAAVLPGALAFAEAAGGSIAGQDFIADLVVGYEVAIRAGIATHRTAPDYHTSGSWNALGVAAIGARRLGLDAAQTREALGIAEYHGPRSQMMRCIDFPTMVKDGSGWGAMTGVQCRTSSPPPASPARPRSWSRASRSATCGPIWAALAAARAVFQAVSGVPLGAAGGGGGRQPDARARGQAGRHRDDRGRQLPRGDPARRAHARPRPRKPSTACPSPSPPRSSAAGSPARRSTAPPSPIPRSSA